MVYCTNTSVKRDRIAQYIMTLSSQSDCEIIVIHSFAIRQRFYNDNSIQMNIILNIIVRWISFLRRCPVCYIIIHCNGLAMGS